MKAFVYVLVGVLLAACGGGGSSSNRVATNPPAAPAPPAAVGTSGVVLDGPVFGGVIHVFRAEQVNQALTEAGSADSRSDSLAAASPIVTLTRAADGDERFELSVPGDLAGEVVFYIFDNQGAVDETFGDRPFNLEAVAVLPAAGETRIVNLTPQTTLISLQVRQALDPDGDGMVLSNAEIEQAIAAATDAAIDVFSADDLGTTVLPAGFDPTGAEDVESMVAAAVPVGRLVRLASQVLQLSLDDVLLLLAADTADGRLDGTAPASFELSASLQAALAEVVELADGSMAVVEEAVAVSCAAASRELEQACHFEVLDEFMVASAICVDTSEEGAAAGCIAQAESTRGDEMGFCGEVLAARLEVCESLDDQPHDPPFGEAFAGQFVDPRQIGGAVAPNPLFPLVAGNQWVFEGQFEEDGELITETITIVVESATKLVAGVRCVTVRDTVVIDGQLIEDTDDWFAQDLAGNVWYCGEEVKDFETFEEDSPGHSGTGGDRRFVQGGAQR